jgi:hypothetical protein
MREPYDQHARNTDVLSVVAAEFAPLPSMTIVDLASGTGATRRAIASQLPRPQHWQMVDNDLSLLARAASAPAPTGCTTRTTPVDLVRDLEAALDGAPDLITCSALLDLVSQPWLARLATECAARRLALYAALTYNGQISLTPSDRFDTDIIAAVNAHQASDKGFGPALGPRAAAALTAQCIALDYEVAEGPSDWIIGADDPEIQRAILTQWAQAAQEMTAMSTLNIASWLTRRLEHVEAGRSTLRVGHTDVFARPMATR